MAAEVRFLNGELICAVGPSDCILDLYWPTSADCFGSVRSRAVLDFRCVDHLWPVFPNKIPLMSKWTIMLRYRLNSLH